jgi:hypothetical protein
MFTGLGSPVLVIQADGSKLRSERSEKRGIPKKNHPLWFSYRMSISAWGDWVVVVVTREKGAADSVSVGSISESVLVRDRSRVMEAVASRLEDLLPEADEALLPSLSRGRRA